MESVFYGFETLKLKIMTNRDLAEKIYEDLNKRGADLGNASIGIIRKTLDDNGVKNCSIPDVVNQRELLLAWEKHSYGSEWSMHKYQIVPSIDEYLSQ
jgi:hypothetical protein